MMKAKMGVATVMAVTCGGFAAMAAQADTLSVPLTNDNAKDQFLYNGSAIGGESLLYVYEDRGGVYTPASGSTPASYTPPASGTGLDGRSLVSFDLPTLPAGATVTSVTLSLYVATNTRPHPVEVSVYQMLTAWNENPVSVAAPNIVESNWTNATASTTWAGAGMLAGSDYVATATDTQTVALSTTESGFMAFDITSAYTAWLGGASNYGLAILSEDPTPYGTNPTFRSTEYGAADTSSKPYLTVTYTIPEPASLGLMGTAGLVTLGVRRREVRA